jgi:hypothetical protein
MEKFGKIAVIDNPNQKYPRLPAQDSRRSFCHSLSAAFRFLYKSTKMEKQAHVTVIMASG